MDKKVIQEVEELTMRLQEDGLKWMVPFYEEHEISFNELRILRIIDESGRLTLNQLAQHMRKAATNLSIAVSKLEKRGLLIRETSKTDKRIIFIEVSEKGHELSKGSYDYFLKLIEDNVEDEMVALHKALKDYSDKMASLNLG
ncbi:MULTISPECIES: MarR family transcriptional regulator [unclassified Breznakia]|uniref:MarR family winged helix-turn-helix transcriptional regulator n=1 Tax=unclassified Breznakia TaxID=2623764 RepID=UPI0024737BBA|nr:MULTISPECIES: MarR family transcriptional regulator [unclassified Breznakia]MDH6367462.1 DNA-binding MarR family transcriptional regulator [Breznakia sp. PH1-1]MDH6404565.1 DNA-binding MarR family transcriptional regulator [Breznakia sp. PF1-11]MDH6412274.1 DNA-binding MarR family transcriptional regulator [Breznakia sp. PFB1-11]MDH6414629.1 DNA-binding MarR family transcriptional regulator [Breznakia sp. PFB1-14]MDH6417000.1 DNA-binding MarR family transcriptional regulator [Breznakia sp. 